MAAGVGCTDGAGCTDGTGCRVGWQELAALWLQELGALTALAALGGRSWLHKN